MSSAIGPGVWIECLAPAGAVSRVRPQIVGGRVYLCDGIEWGYACGKCKSREHPGVHIVGVERDPAGFAGCEWRPVYRPNADLIESLKQPAPDAVRDLVAAD